VTQATAATVILTGSYQVWILALIEVANGTLAAFSTPATRGIVPQLVPTAQLPKANALLATARSAATIIGPSIAGLVVATTSGGWALAFDAATYAFAFGCLGHLRITGRPAQQSGILREIRDGWTSFRSLQWVWVVVISVGLTNFARSGVWGVLGPTIAKHSIGAPAWGLVVSTRAIGLLVMGLVMYRVVFRRFLFVGQCALVFGSLPLILLGVSPNTGALCCGAFLAGAGSGVFGPAWETSLQEHVPPGMLSRISSYDDLLSFAPVPVGQLLVGPLALAVGAEPVAATGGAVFLLAAIMPVFVRSVRQLPHRTAAETE
jgi:MFS family permease